MRLSVCLRGGLLRDLWVLLTTMSMHRLIRYVLEFLARPSVAKRAVILLGCLLMAYGVGLLVLRTVLPVQLDVMEGKVFCQAYEVAIGNPAYRDPGAPGAPPMYTPFYALLMGQILKVVPPLFLWGRAASLVVSVLTLLLLARPFRDAPERLWVLFLMAVMFAASAWETEWTACAFRPDALCHMVWILGLILTLRRRATWDAAGALLMAMAFFAKQTAVLALPGTLLYLWLDTPRRAVRFAMLWAVGFGLGFALTRLWAGEGTAFHVFYRMGLQVERSFPLSQVMHHAGSFRESPLTVAAVIAAAAGWQRLWEVPAYRMAMCNLPFLFLGGVLTASAYTAGANSLMPAFYGMILAGGFSWSVVPDAWKHRSLFWWSLCALAVLQFDARMPYHVSKSLGRFDQDYAGVVQYLRHQGGTMYCPSDNSITLLAGHQGYDDRHLAWEIDPACTGPVRRVAARMNACDTEWLIIKRSERDEDVLVEATRRRYEPAADFGDWQVWRRRGEGD